MSNVVRIQEQNTAEVVDFRMQKAKLKGKEVKLKKDGTPWNIVSNSKKGDPHEVYPIKDKEQIEQMKQYFRDKIEEAPTDFKKQLAARNLMLWIVSINIGLRMSDILNLTWGRIFNSDGTFADAIRVQEKKTKKYKEFFLNSGCKNAITEYIENYNVNTSPELHVFRSRESGTLDVKSVNRIIQQAAKSIGIQYRVGTHTCRKTWAYQQIIAHQNDAQFIAHLMYLLNHSSQSATLHYAGITSEQNKQYYDDVVL